MLERLMEWFLRKFRLFRKLESQNERLYKDLQKALAGEMTVESMIIEHGGFTVELGTKMATVIANSFHESLKLTDAENYIEYQFKTSEGDTICVTARRHHGKTPHQLRTEAEVKLKALLKKSDP